MTPRVVVPAVWLHALTHPMCELRCASCARSRSLHVHAPGVRARPPGMWCVQQARPRQNLLLVRPRRHVSGMDVRVSAGPCTTQRRGRCRVFGQRGRHRVIPHEVAALLRRVHCHCSRPRHHSLRLVLRLRRGASRNSTPTTLSSCWTTRPTPCHSTRGCCATSSSSTVAPTTAARTRSTSPSELATCAPTASASVGPHWGMRSTAIKNVGRQFGLSKHTISSAQVGSLNAALSRHVHALATRPDLLQQSCVVLHPPFFLSPQRRAPSSVLHCACGGSLHVASRPFLP